MPELRRTFSAGRMNKDIDERLLAPGEYRDALNVGVGNSESSDIGSVENLLGNESKPFARRLPGGEFEPLFLTQATTVGAIRFDLEEKIYWFTAAQEGSFIFEYDQTTDVVTPILSDTQGILNFSSDFLITGVNILGGQLFWTDNQTEPKKINIATFKEATRGLLNHTRLYGRNFVEADITVIKRSPLNAPNLRVSETLRPDGGEFNVTTNADLSNTSVGVSINITLSSPSHAYLEGDSISLTSNTATGTVSSTATVTMVVGTRLTVTINTLTNVDESGSLIYNVDIIGNDVIFELKFPRFAYRWKYTDGEYSVYSPFTEVAFIPGQYEYNSEKGYNLAMTNNVRQVVLDTFDTAPDDVVEIDVLYKESDSNPIYTVETIPVTQETVTVTDEQIHSVVADDQILRPYDDVPRTAKAQEIIANRIVYGNYTHNYDVDVDPEFTIGLINREGSRRSIKSLRNYQFGVVYQDQYGRQTPVLSNTTASHQVTIDTSDQATQFSVGLNSDAPEWATDYKIYIKETSNEYYNLALDRYYSTEDGFVWCSFPSSERSKITEDSYLILKKQHSTGVPVKDEEARYKIIDIENEAPEELTQSEESVANISYRAVVLDHERSRPFANTTPVEDSTDDDFNIETVLPETGNLTFTWSVNPESSYYADVKTGNFIIFSNGAESARYEIAGVTDDASVAGNFIVEVTEEFTNNIAFVTDNTDPNAPVLADDVTIEIIQETREQLAEFIGRFFVKLVKNNAFETNVIEPSTIDNEPEYGVLAENEIFDQLQPDGPGASEREFFFDFRAEALWKRNRLQNVDRAILDPAGVGIRVGSNRVDISFSGTQPHGFDHPEFSNEFGDHLGRTGTLLRFVEGGEVYRIVSVEHHAGPNLNAFGGNRGNATPVLSDGTQAVRREGLGTTSYKRWSITLDKNVTERPSLTENVNRAIDGPSTAVGNIQVVRDLTETARLRSGGTPYFSDPAIFETEPTGDSVLDLYYETEQSYPISQHSTPQNIRWFNCFSFGNGVESDRIRDDYNAIRIDKGPRVSATIAEQFREEHRPSGFIWSGIFNSVTGINRTNQFSLAEGIQKEIQPQYGSIQKLHARDTNLITLCEDKILRILADKDALFNADGSSNVTASNNVLGQTTPYVGEYGISRNPESFATFGHRIYFADKNRGVILRLSQDGLTEISSNGMEDFFRDLFMAQSGPIIGSYDDYHDVFNITFSNFTVTYDESVTGWPSRKSFVPEWGLTLNNRYYTWKDGNLWLHNSNQVSRNNFYGTQYTSAIVFIFNDNPGSIKNFLTLNYEGTQPRTLTTYNLNDDPVCTDTANGGWICSLLTTDQQVADAKSFLNKEGKWFSEIYVLGSTEAVSQTLSTFDNISSDGTTQTSGGANGPLLSDDSTFSDLSSAIAGESFSDLENIYTPDIGDGIILGPLEEDPIETDDDGVPLPDQSSARETTITITID